MGAWRGFAQDHLAAWLATGSSASSQLSGKLAGRLAGWLANTYRVEGGGSERANANFNAKVKIWLARHQAGS